MSNNLELYNGVKMPINGFGLHRMPQSQETVDTVITAVKAGYRHIDTAWIYENEYSVGIAVKECIKRGIVKREDLFITTKLCTHKLGYNSALKCFNESLNNLGLEYIDMYIIHTPGRYLENNEEKIVDSWRALENIYKSGKTKAIGVSQFEINHLELLKNETDIKPMLNQIELHPTNQQKEVVKYCQNNNIVLGAWGALNQGNTCKIPLIIEIANKYNKTPAQIALRWSLQRGFAPLSRSGKKENIIANANIYDFELTNEDMLLINSLDSFFTSSFGDYMQAKPPVRITLDEVNKIQTRKEEFLSNYKYTYYLFGFIPFLTKWQPDKNKTKWHLFGFLPIFKSKRKWIEKGK